MKKINVYSLLFAIFSAFCVNAQEVQLIVPEMTVDPEETFSIDIKAADFDDIASMQFAIFWNPDIIQFKSVGNLNGNMPEFDGTDDFNLSHTSDGRLKVIWFWFDPATNSGVTLDDNSTLFSLVFKAIGSQGANSMVEITNDTTVNPPFTIEFSNFNEIVDVAVDNGKVTIAGVNSSEETMTEDFTLFQNNPNPFTEITYITFNLNTSSDAKLTVFDNSGKAVYQQAQKYPAGLSRIPVRRDMLTASGSYFYTLETARATATRQLIMQ